jgi:hypothetical protein
MFMADFCINPLANAAQALPKGTEVQSIAQYYATCDPYSLLSIVDFDKSTRHLLNLENPLLSLNATELTSKVDDVLKQVPTSICFTNEDILLATQEIDGITNSVSNVLGEISCSSVQKYLNDVFNASLCSNVFLGLCVIMICFYIICAGLYITMGSGSVLWEYFDTWKSTEEEESQVISPIVADLGTAPFYPQKSNSYNL